MPALTQAAVGWQAADPHLDVDSGAASGGCSAVRQCGSPADATMTASGSSRDLVSASQSPAVIQTPRSKFPDRRASTCCDQF
ncbi:hypothetical protein Dda_6030 [Drechslerella dactyloides]|uniref:Uncharacterized protein n=1 Tax=Drechslerella dactyloides TaxID=74499 RepID=A0AAD6NJK0_DREDA|nr:hypothetical protein Dda_6030 [Drechslerella dactyloides]